MLKPVPAANFTLRFATIALALCCSRAEPVADAGAPAGFADVREAIAVLRGTEGHDVKGVVRFLPHADGVELDVSIDGLPSGTRHGFHVHEFGDCSAPDASSAGGHYDPTGNMAAQHATGMRPLGDLDDLRPGPDGKVKVRFVARALSIAKDNPILGRALLLHESFDDPNDPMVAAGDRIACGTIGVHQPETP